MMKPLALIDKALAFVDGALACVACFLEPLHMRFDFGALDEAPIMMVEPLFML